MTNKFGRMALPIMLILGIALVLFFEWHTDEPLVVLPVLLVTSFGIGLAAPRHALLSGATLGWTILVAHAVSNASGMFIPRYQHAQPVASDWLAMALLVIPALAASFAGAMSRKQAE